MKILDANTFAAKEDLLELIGRIKTVDRTPDELEYWLRSNLATDVFGAWVAQDDDGELAGMVTCELVWNQFKPLCFIPFTWIDGKADIGLELMAKVEEWARERELDKIQMYTRRKPSAFERKYGFKIERIVMSKEIG